MSNSIENAPPPESGDAQPADPVGIPNVARGSIRHMDKRALLLGGGALVVALGAAGAGYWKISQYLNAQDQAKRDAAATKPASAMGVARKLPDEMPVMAATAPSPASAASAPPRHRVPDVEGDDAIRVIDNRQRTQGNGAYAGAAPARKIDPRDAPMLLPPSSTRAPSATGLAGAAPGAIPGGSPAGGDDLAQARDQLRQQREALTNQLNGMMQRMGGQPAPAGGFIKTAMPAGSLPQLPAMPGAALAQRAQDDAPTERTPIVAGQIGDMNLTLAEGDSFTCTLTVEVVSDVAGRLKCITQQDVRGVNQQVVLAEKGSLVTGEYSIANVRPGVRAIQATWTRLRTPYGVTVPLKWNAIGPLGGTGITGHVDNRWPERIGASLLLKLIDDAVKVVIADKRDSAAGTVVYGEGTLKESSNIAGKVLDSTINIPPRITRNQGTVVGVDVMHDVDFSRVYAVRPRR